MPIHKLVDEGGEKYLAFALSKLRQLSKEAEKRGGYAVRRITTDDGFTIELSVAGKQQHLHISGGGLKYEFFTSEHILREVPGGGDVYFSSPGYSIDETADAAAHVVGSLTRLILPSKRAKPVYSQVLPASDGEWRNADPLEGLDPSAPRKGYPISWGAWQFQKAFEYVWWPDNKRHAMVTSTQALAPGRNSQCNDLSPYKTFRLAGYDAFISDYGLDVPPTYVDAKGKRAAGPAFESPFVWWRKAAVQKGYFICTDNVGRFHVYPIQDKRDGTPQPYSIPNDSFKTFTPPYPDWVTLPEVGTFHALTQCWTWQFNKDATRCVACPFKADVSFFYKRSHIFSAGARLPGQPGGVPPDWIPGREDIPGMVEFKIEIIPGSSGDPMDFDVDFTLLRSNYSGSAADGRYIFDAAYTLPDKDETMGVPEDTLVTSEIEIKTTAAEGFLDTGLIDYTLPDSTHVTVEVRNQVGPIRAEYVMNAYPGENMAVTEIMRFPIYQSSDQMFFFTHNGWADAEYPIMSTVLADEMSPVKGEVIDPISGSPFTTFALAYLHMIELRTMSIAWTFEDYRKMTSHTKLYAYNKLHSEASGSIGTPIPELLPTYDTPVPSYLTFVYSYVLDNALDTVWGSGFNIHPDGHWSCSRGRGIAGFDIIKPYDKPQMSHKDIFNKAFNQIREYDFYGLYSNFGRFFDSSIPTSGWDMGSFRTNGVWIHF